MRIRALAIALASSASLASAGTSGPNELDSARVVKIRHWTWPTYTRVVVDLDRLVQFEQHRLADPDRFYLDLSGARIDRELHNHAITVDGFLSRIRIAQYDPTTVRVVLDTAGTSTIKVFPMLAPDRLVIDVFGQERSAELGTEVQPDDHGKYSLSRQLGLKVRRIVLDPGHGGKDPGALGPGGLQEKQITLDVAKRLRAQLGEQLPGTEVLLTRSDDRYLSLPERTALANAQGDLFLSIHVNSSYNPRAHGVETYYLNFATDPEAMQVAARENAVSDKRMADLLPLVKSILRNSKISESAEFARVVQDELVTELRAAHPTVRDLGVKRAPFYVLIGAQVPSILAEIAFISHAGEREKLSDPEYRERVAAGLARGIHGYLERAGTLIAQR